jgi:AGZA family xanthine/uracil permease-like MFS transporter
MGIPFFYNIADGIAIGLIVYPLIKVVGGRGRELSWGMWAVTALLVFYFVAVRSRF